MAAAVASAAAAAAAAAAAEEDGEDDEENDEDNDNEEPELEEITYRQRTYYLNPISKEVYAVEADESVGALVGVFDGKKVRFYAAAN